VLPRFLLFANGIQYCAPPPGRGRCVSLGGILPASSHETDTPFAPDAIIHSRITNDERALRRVVKKFTSYTTVAHSQVDSPSSEQMSSAVEDAREAFLLELSSFSLQLRKAMMVCEAEARQVDEYYRERQRIGEQSAPFPRSTFSFLWPCTEDEHGSLKGQIEQLKTSLEHAQVERKRKIEYDSFAEKINTLPNRTELERCGL
jgi:THO complex subunit 7